MKKFMLVAVPVVAALLFVSVLSYSETITEQDGGQADLPPLDRLDDQRPPATDVGDVGRHAARRGGLFRLGHRRLLLRGS